MLFIRLSILFLLLGLKPFAAHAQDETALQLLNRVQTSLVEIRTATSKTFDANGHTVMGTYHSEGSGVILDSYGTIVTNTHVIANAEHIYVGLSDGKILEARPVHSSDADFSFIKVDPPYPLTPIRWADSSQASVGMPIIGLANAADGQQHVVGGAITNMMNGMDSNNIELLELNLDLHPGDSGGPLLDGEGRLLGIIMAKQKETQDKTYAIASNKIQQEYDQYQQNLPV